MTRFREQDIITLEGLPPDCKVMWHNLIPGIDFRDEDITWIKLKNGMGIDCGYYGGRDWPYFYNVVAVPPDMEQWVPIEEIHCKTAEEAAKAIVYLANKYNDEWYLNLAKLMGKEKEI